MTLNPLNLLDSLLQDYASPKARRGVHTAILLVLSLVAVWFAAEKDWHEALTSLAVLAYAGANRANTAPPVTDSDLDDTKVDPDYIEGDSEGYSEGYTEGDAAGDETLYENDPH